MLTKDESIELENLLYNQIISESRNDLLKFTATTFKKFEPEWFHIKFYDILNRFANTEIKNLIISMPPQHGKSEGSSRRLPAYIAGLRPDEKQAVVSFAAHKAEKFGREIMGIMNENEYKAIFPNVKYPDRGYPGQKANTNQNRESINSDGSMKFVGVGGPLTGDPVDVLIMDDLYKDWHDGNSPIVQKRIWDWYISVAETRLHNDSQQLIVFTRWSENDLIAKLEDVGKVVEWNGNESLDDLIVKLKHDEFLKINWTAIKEGSINEFDQRKDGEALWPKKHSLQKLVSTRDKDPDKFDCLYQGNPVNKDGLLYPNEFKTYSSLPVFKIKKNYTDTADTGKDNLCSINYGVALSETNEHLYVIDLVYTDKAMEKTEPLVASILINNLINTTKIESNNGGRSFARNVEAITKKEEIPITYNWFHQSNNKEARIFSNSATVNRRIVFPDDWHIRWPEFYKAVTKYKKIFSLNEFDDAPDTLTGIIEEESKSNFRISPEVNANDLGLF
jgi:predicted phage terminase large subunit-like protein